MSVHSSESFCLSSRASFCSPSQNEISFFYPHFASCVHRILSHLTMGHKVPPFLELKELQRDMAAEGGDMGGRTWGARHGKGKDDNRQLGQVFGRRIIE